MICNRIKRLSNNNALLRKALLFLFSFILHQQKLTVYFFNWSLFLGTGTKTGFFKPNRIAKTSPKFIYIIFKGKKLISYVSFIWYDDNVIYKMNARLYC